MTTHYCVRVDTHGDSHEVTVTANVLATRAALVDMARQRAGIDPAAVRGGTVLGATDAPDTAPAASAEPRLVADGGHPHGGRVTSDVERSCRKVMDGLEGLTPDKIREELADEDEAELLARQLEDMYMEIDSVIGDIAGAEKTSEAEP